MTSAQIRQTIYDLTGYKVGTRLNTGSMKEYTRFNIAKNGNPLGAAFTIQQQAEIKQAIKLPLFTDSYQIDVKLPLTIQ